MAKMADLKMVNFQADRALADEAKLVLEAKGMSMKQAFNLFLKNIVVTQEVNLKTEEELEKEKLFKDLQAEVAKNIEEIEGGQFMTLDELEATLLG